jgi:hypothetical protein
MDKLLELVAKFESVKESVKAFVAGTQAIIDGRVAEGIAGAKAGMQADLESAGVRASTAEARVAELMAGVDAAVAELKADADEVAAAVAVKTPAEAEPAAPEAVAEAAVEAVKEENI